MMLSVQVTKRRGSFALDVNFELPTPGVAALFGRSGCGKSTLVNIISGLVRPDTGRVTLDDTVLLDTSRGINVPAERRGIGYVFQDARLFPHLSVAGNLQYAVRRARDVPFVDLAAVTRLLDLQPLLRRRPHELSGGERQRVAIGRALLAQPRLLLLDEPLAALDAARRDEVLPYLETLRDELAIPIVYVTHDFSEVMRLSTHLVLMQSGSLTAQGNLADMSLDPVLRSIIGPDQVGAIIDGSVLGIDPISRLTRIRIGNGEISVHAAELARGSSLRVQLLARDIIISTALPQNLSVRNCISGTVKHIQGDDRESDLVLVDIGGVEVIARITKAATAELSLRSGTPIWALVKSASLRGHVFAAPSHPHG